MWVNIKKNKGLEVKREEVASLMEVEMFDEIIEVKSAIAHLGISFSEGGIS